jgi:signal transduction histidine kinase
VNLYSNKQRWKIVLLAAALVIAGVTLWYSNDLAQKIREEEQLKVKLWSEAILQRAQLVTYTQALFEDLRREEREKADRLATAYQLINDPPADMDLTFVTDYLWSNKTIPVLITDRRDSIIYRINLPPKKAANRAYNDSLLKVMAERNAPILLKDVGHTIYYNESYRFSELKSVMQDLINSFISETVINSASVPVVLTDSTRQRVVRAERVDTLDLADEGLLALRLRRMANQNEPIAIDLPDSGTHYIFYEDSIILRQLQFFPVVQLVLIGVFLLVAYLIFSTFRKAEQNQVWVGMAKETAHQLGTPLSSLMAWLELLEAKGIDRETLDEINKDLVRLTTITDRFEKIGSKPKLEPHNLVDLVEQSFHYLKTRTSRKVNFSVVYDNQFGDVMVSVPLFSWVIENLVKNAIDAMEGVGELNAHIGIEGQYLFVDISDTGKGIPKAMHKTVFEPGFTTKKRGWGLGLSLTKRIMESYHGGRIFVKRSEPGAGTTFRVMLKRADRWA